MNLDCHISSWQLSLGWKIGVCGDVAGCTMLLHVRSGIMLWIATEQLAELLFG